MVCEGMNKLRVQLMLLAEVPRLGTNATKSNITSLSHTSLIGNIILIVHCLYKHLATLHIYTCDLTKMSLCINKKH